ncbi:unnamed protein product [Pleuronectes platessa]|uniref:Uncharacterized protein n=1 Tax=Pleuronectes platessa TaxID=8262 RepID=A0A9N7VIZ1_PLEPL|nr:unnamed protein product [Pleuronectes platessa]
MEEKLWILEDLNMMYIRQIALSLQVSSAWQECSLVESRFGKGPSVITQAYSHESNDMQVGVQPTSLGIGSPHLSGIHSRVRANAHSSTTNHFIAQRSLLSSSLCVSVCLRPSNIKSANHSPNHLAFPRFTSSPNASPTHPPPVPHTPRPYTSGLTPAIAPIQQLGGAAQVSEWALCVSRNQLDAAASASFLQKTGDASQESEKEKTQRQAERCCCWNSSCRSCSDTDDVSDEDEADDDEDNTECGANA